MSIRPRFLARCSALSGAALLLLTALLAGCAAPVTQPPRAAPEAAAPPVPAPGSLHTIGFDGGSLLVDTRATACRITLSGAIHEDTVRRMHSAMQRIEAAHCTQRLLQLETGAAQVGSAITLGAMLRNRRFDTLVPAGRVCDTPCLLVFAAGIQRTLAHGAQPAQLAITQLPPDADFGQRSCRSEPNAAQQLTLARYLNAMLPEPTSSTVLRQVLAADCNGSARLGPEQALALGLATSTTARR